MKSLSLARPLLILVVGLPGAGKSFFAEQFSETFGAPIVAADRLRHEIFKDAKVNAEGVKLVERLRNHFVEEIAKTKRSFLIDGACNSRPERQRFYRFAKDHGYDVFVVWVQTDPATARQRATRRGTKLSESISEQQFAALTNQFSAPANEDHVVISGKHTYATQAKMVLRRLAAPRAVAAEQAHAEKSVPQREAAKAPPRPAKTPVRRNLIIQ